MELTAMKTASRDFAVVRCTVKIAKSREDAWKKIGSFAGAGAFLNLPSSILVGSGEIGSVRNVTDAIEEVMVGSSKFSYTYAQTLGPMAALAYHGCVALEADGANTSTLHYTILFDQSGFDPAKKASETDRIRARFQGMAEAMKKTAEHHE